MLPKDLDELWDLIGNAAAGGAVVGVLRGVIQRRYGGWLQWLSMLSAAALVAVLVGLATEGTMTRAQQFATVGASAFVAEDVLIGLSTLASLFGKDPIGTFKKIWDALRGRGS